MTIGSGASALTVRQIARLAALAACFASIPTADSAEIEWPEPWYNFESLPDDVIMPLPCGGAMTFRVVSTPVADGALSDLRVRIGRPDTEFGFLDYLRHAHLRGSLQDPADGQWYFLLGKYEVTVNQWAVIAAGDGPCPTLNPGLAGHFPKTGISWFDAVDLSHRLSEWLLAEAADKLPTQDGVRAYVRLPTETEWEYAARGGAKVKDELEFNQSRFKMEGELDDYAVYNAEDDPRALPMGPRKHNPLGLVDMLGNAEELVLEPFRLNRAGREHGQVGGFIVRGGSFLDPESAMVTSFRDEYAYFDPGTGKAWATDTIGLRLAIAAPAITSVGRSDTLRSAFAQLQKETTSPRPPDQPAPLPEFDRLIAQQEADAMRTELEELKALVFAEQERRNEIEARALRNGLLSGGIFVRGLRQDANIVDILTRQVTLTEERLSRADERNVPEELRADRTLELVHARLREAHDRLRTTTRGFGATLDRLVSDSTANAAAAQAERLRAELNSSGLANLVPSVRLFEGALEAYRSAPDASAAELIALVTGSPEPAP